MTTEEGCVERDGVLRNRRGFVCPPHLYDSTWNNVEPNWYLPGTYETRTFAPGFRFTRQQRFRSPGEIPYVPVVSLDFKEDSDSASAVEALGGEFAEIRVLDLSPVNLPDGWEWYEDLRVEETEIGGYPATMSTFRSTCQPPGQQTVVRNCLFPVLGTDLLIDHDQINVMIDVETPEPLLLWIHEDSPDFDTYWTEVAQPILDSIEFLDP